MLSRSTVTHLRDLLMSDYERQLQLEELQSDMGITRYRSAVASSIEHGAETRTDYHQLLMRRLVGPVEEALTEWLDEKSLNTMSMIAQEHDVHEVVIESNFRDGMFASLLKPFLKRNHPVTI